MSAPFLAKATDEELLALDADQVVAELSARGYVYGWHRPAPKRPALEPAPEKPKPAGFVYILVNEAFPDLVKIGYADDVGRRVRQLNRNSGLPDPYHCFAAYEVKRRLEDLRLHKLIDMLNSSLRHSANREFFEMSKEKAWDILSAIAQINGDEDKLRANPLEDPFFTQGDLAVAAAYPAGGEKKRKPRLTFGMLGIPEGSALSFSEDSSIEVATVGLGSLVEFPGGERMSLSAAVRKIKDALGTGNSCGSYQGGQYFVYESELLTDRRARLEKEAGVQS